MGQGIQLKLSGDKRLQERDIWNLTYGTSAEQRETSAVSEIVTVALPAVKFAKIDCHGVRAVRIQCHGNPNNPVAYNLMVRQFHKQVWGGDMYAAAAPNFDLSVLIEFPCPTLELWAFRVQFDAQLYASWYLVPFDVMQDPLSNPKTGL